MTWMLIILFLGDPTPRDPLFMSMPDKAFCESMQHAASETTRKGYTKTPPHVSWCVPWPADVPLPKFQERS